MLVLLLLQAVVGAPPQTIDLLAKPERCQSTEGEVVVCARPSDQRIEPLPAPERSGPPDGPLSFRLPGGGTGNVHAIQSTLPGGSGSGAVVTLKIPF